MTPPCAELRVRVTTRASRERVEPDGAGGCLVWVSAPPADGEANKAVVELVAKSIGVAKTSVTVRQGAKSRSKVLALATMTPDDVDQWLARLPGGKG
ncbi:MAG: DUF167 domain-containing protein [Fimbriimonadaceae bacterium]|nr:DUF167 domain-containing protein [Fimbriimonadaceae bacterium]